VASVDGVNHFSLTAIESDESIPVFDYKGGYVAPTIEVNPGDQLQVQFENGLAPRSAKMARGRFNETNLHFHGLTVSPEPPGDDSLDMLRPRFSTEYIVDISPHQPPGLYWYHPHPHGESAWQVGNGMSGALIVGGIQNDVPAVAGLRERLLIVRQAVSENENDERAAAGRKFCGLKRMTPAQRAAFLKRAGVASPLPKQSAELEETALTINGLAAGSVQIGIARGERQLLRVLNATGSRNLDLSIGNQDLELVAQDGVPLADFPGGPQARKVRHIVIPPAGRAEFVVTGTGVPAVLRTSAYDTGPQGDKNPQANLATLVDDGGAKPRDRRLPQRDAHAPKAPDVDYYRLALPAPSVERIVRLQEKADGTDFRINGASYDPSDKPMFVAKAGTIERWTLLNTTDEIHDFHVHQVHFVVESIDGVQVPAAERHWSDEVNVPYQHHHAAGASTPGTAVILVDLRDPVIRGTFLFHCHILDHEDGGMMAKMKVI
jgi:FtsP/CotA-like multicopper oxidase with cupredoxin domain